MGDMAILAEHPFEFMVDFPTRDGPIVHINARLARYMAPFKFYLLSHPGYIQQVLQASNRNYIKDQRMVNILEVTGDSNLFTSDGQEWRQRRRMHELEDSDRPPDLLDMLLDAYIGEDEQALTFDEFITEMSDIIFAGHETTSTTLTFALYLLSTQPEMVDKLDVICKNRRRMGCLGPDRTVSCHSFELVPPPIVE